MKMTQFIPFSARDFELMQNVDKGQLPSALQTKIDALRHELNQYPEFQLASFRNRVVRRPGMIGDREDGLVFGHPRSDSKHWYLYVVGGDQDQVQLNIGMFPSHLRVGLGFQIGRQVRPKIPAFHLLQTFLGVRPPLPFRDAFLQTIKKQKFSIEDRGDPTFGTPEELVELLETFVVPADEDATFILIGAIWKPKEASEKRTADFREVFRQLLPFYEALVLMGGRFAYYD